jgi:hypothetical protein
VKSVLIRGFVVAGFAAGLAVHQPVGADANVDRCLAEAAEFFALAAVLRFLTLRATILGGAGSGRHEARLALGIQCKEHHVGNQPQLCLHVPYNFPQ